MVKNPFADSRLLFELGSPDGIPTFLWYCMTPHMHHIVNMYRDHIVNIYLDCIVDIYMDETIVLQYLKYPLLSTAT